MTRGLTENMALAVAERLVMPALLGEFEFSSATLRFWTGLGILSWNGNDYTGGGTMLGASPYGESQDLKAEGMTFTLSGIPSSLIAAALDEYYKNRPCRIYLALMTGSSSQALALQSGGALLLQGGGRVALAGSMSLEEKLIDSPYLLFEGLMKTMRIVESAETATIEVGAENEMVKLMRAKESRYTAEDQKARYPGDLGLDFIPQLQDREVLWQAPR